MLSFAERCPIWRTLWPVQRDSARSERTPGERHILEKRGMARTSCRKLSISLTLYFCSCFCKCRQCLSSWEVQMWQMAPCHNHWDSAVLLKLVSLRFMHSILRYSPKRKGHPKAFLALIFKLLRCFYNHAVKFAKKHICPEIQFLFFLWKVSEISYYQSNAW